MGECYLFNFVLWGVISSVSCILGMMGNALAFTAFQKDRRSPATTLIQSLASSDFVLLAAVFFTDSLPYACSYTKQCPNLWVTWPYIRYVWIVTPAAHMCSIWFVVLIASNRFWAVCRPHKMQNVWSISRTGLYIVCVIITVVAFNVPRIFEYAVVEMESTPENDFSINQTEALSDKDNATTYVDENNSDAVSNNITTYIVSDNNITYTYLKEIRTHFGNRYSYKVVYKAYLVNIVLVMLPLLTLILLTARILRALNVRKKKSKDIKNSTMARASSEITFLLVLVVVVAIVCQTPLAIFHFVRYTQQYGCGDFIFYLDNISKLLVTINSSVNFTIYCLFSAKFRKLLFATITCNGVGSQIEPYSSTRTRGNKDYSMASMKGWWHHSDVDNTTWCHQNDGKEILNWMREECLGKKAICLSCSLNITK